MADTTNLLSYIHSYLAPEHDDHTNDEHNEYDREESESKRRVLEVKLHGLLIAMRLFVYKFEKKVSYVIKLYILTKLSYFADS